jgi:hypothetical protein
MELWVFGSSAMAAERAKKLPQIILSKQLKSGNFGCFFVESKAGFTVEFKVI